MPSLQQLRRRLKSVKSIHQITRAMEMISTSKMKKATKKVLRARDYYQGIHEISARLGDYSHPFLEKRKAEKIMLIFITADRGLCGGFNSALFRELVSFIGEIEEKKQKASIITVGKKGRDFVARFEQDKNPSLRSGTLLLRNKLLADFTGIKDEILYQEVTPVVHLITQEYFLKKTDQVQILYNHCISNFVQKPTLIQLLPVGRNQNVRQEDCLLEPSPKEFLKVLLPRLIETQIYQALLESKAAEHSARMIAMKNATENAKDLMDELYLTYNSIRQATITSELIDMTTAKRAMEE